MTRRLLVPIVLLILFGTYYILNVNASSWTQDLNNNLVGYWKFDDNLTTTNVLDSLGVSNMSSSPLNTINYSITGKLNNSFNFNGVNTQVNISNQNLNYSRWTYSFWFNASNINLATNRLFYSRAGNFGTLVQTAANGIPNYFCGNGNSLTSGSLSVGDSLFNNTWYFITITSNGTHCLGYRDGTYIGTFAKVFTNASVSLNIGSAGGSSFFNGSIDEVSIWNRSLSATEISNLYNGGAGITYGDSCTPPLVNNNWTINFDNYCTVNTNVDLGDGVLNIVGSNGTLSINANITLHGRTITCSTSPCTIAINKGGGFIFV